KATTMGYRGNWNMNVLVGEESRAFVRRSAKIKKPWTGARRPGAGDSARPVSGCLAAKTHRPLRSKTVSFLQRKCLYHVRHEKGSNRAAKNGKNPVPQLRRGFIP